MICFRARSAFVLVVNQEKSGLRWRQRLHDENNWSSFGVTGCPLPIAST